MNRIRQTYIPPADPATPAWPPSETTGKAYYPPDPAPAVVSNFPRSLGVVPTPPTMTWVDPGTPLPQPGRCPNRVRLDATQRNDLGGPVRAMQTSPTHGNVVPHKPSLVDAFGQGVTQARPNEATYNGVFRTPWYFSPEMRQAWIEDHLKNYCVQQDPKVIVSMGNSREEAFAAQLEAMTPRQRHSIFFMPG